MASFYTESQFVSSTISRSPRLGKACYCHRLSLPTTASPVARTTSTSGANSRVPVQGPTQREASWTEVPPLLHKSQRNRPQMHLGNRELDTACTAAEAQQHRTQRLRLNTNKFASSIRFHRASFTSSLTLSSKCFATFPHGTCSLSVS
jgi:hypothetical protein